MMDVSSSQISKFHFGNFSQIMNLLIPIIGIDLVHLELKNMSYCWNLKRLGTHRFSSKMELSVRLLTSSLLLTSCWGRRFLPSPKRPDFQRSKEGI